MKPFDAASQPCSGNTPSTRLRSLAQGELLDPSTPLRFAQGRLLRQAPLGEYALREVAFSDRLEGLPGLSTGKS
jgi:hypothetical protein